MTRMIPDSIGDDSPPGERELFSRLRDAKGTDGWVAFHSLNIARHATQVEGETDFVVLVPGEGVLIIEVKSHLRVEATGDGYWKLGNDKASRKSPFDQASGSMHSVEEYVSRRGIRLSGYPIWNCVWFTSIPKARIPQSIGWQQWMMLDADDLAGDAAAVIVDMLRRGATYLDEKTSGFHKIAGKPTAAEVQSLVEVLEPRFVAEATPEELERMRRSAVDQFSKDQVEILDALVDVPRLLIDGPVGSGKSVVAIEAARRAAAKGESVLFIAAAPRLVAVLRAKLPGVDALTIAELGTEEDRQWDLLVVDDAEQIASDDDFAVLERALTGGLVNGRSVIAGNFAALEQKALWISRIPTAVPLRLTEVFGG
jgi:hypothetical protein